VPTRPGERILAEWRALEHAIALTSDRDDEEAIRGRIDQLRDAYQQATGSPLTTESEATGQLRLPLRFAPHVVHAAQHATDVPRE
jgi:hypothetical protein